MESFSEGRAWVTLVLLIVLWSCAPVHQKPAPASDCDMAPFIRFEYAIYLPAAPSVTDADAKQLVAEALRESPEIKLVSELPKVPHSRLVYPSLKQNARDDYAPPGVKLLRYSGHGLSSEETEALQRSAQALVLDFAHPRKEVWTGLRSAAELAEKLARKVNGFVWDEETREVFTPDAWRKERLSEGTQDVPRISHQITIHIYEAGSSVRAISLGMAKMGLPDLVVEQTSWSSSDQAGNLINLVGQAMAEGKTAGRSGRFKLVLREIRNADAREPVLKSSKKNAAGVGCLILFPGNQEEGDPDNRLLQLSFDKYPGKDSRAQQDAMIDSFYGWEDSVKYLRNNKDNDELLAATALAKRQLPALQKSFALGFQPGEYLEVKAPFKTKSGGTEWMWVEVKTWKGNRITGVLDNKPVDIPGLDSGQRVEVREEDIFDYIHTFPDKRTEGNTTGPIIERLQEWDETPRDPVAVPACDGS